MSRRKRKKAGALPGILTAVILTAFTVLSAYNENVKPKTPESDIQTPVLTDEAVQAYTETPEEEENVSTATADDSEENDSEYIDETDNTDIEETDMDSESPEEETETGEEVILSENDIIINDALSSMTLREKLGQMFIVGYDDEWYTTSYVENYDFAAFITFPEDFENETPESLKTKIDNVKAKCKYGAILCVDEEGGTVTRISRYPQFRSEPFESPREINNKSGLEGIRANAVEKAELMLACGHNMNLAPVVDISLSEDDFMYYRSMGADAEITSEMAEIIITESSKLGVCSVVKHFPGYGAVSDTHTGMAYDDRSLEELEENDIIPFRRAAQSGVQGIMISHIITAALDSDRPASVSPKVVDYIRNNIGYDGVIVSDDMGMNGILDYCSDTVSDCASLEAILAGIDLVCCTNWYEQYPAVWAAVEDGRLTEERMNESVRRILKMKLENGIWIP